jgi:hypothetical protein
MHVGVANEERVMRAKWPALTILLALCAGYVGYPYATLYRLTVAVRQADAATLQSMVDWYSVREGLKEDLCDMAVDDPANARPSNELAPFGESFVRGIIGNLPDKNVTPETLVSMTRATHAAPRPDTHVVWAFFNNPTRFLVDVRANGSVEPIRIVMELRGMRWRVRRVWLPNKMLERANSGT